MGPLSRPERGGRWEPLMRRAKARGVSSSVGVGVNLGLRLEGLGCVRGAGLVVGRGLAIWEGGRLKDEDDAAEEG